jgi:hypothetical protein
VEGAGDRPPDRARLSDLGGSSSRCSKKPTANPTAAPGRPFWLSKVDPSSDERPSWGFLGDLRVMILATRVFIGMNNSYEHRR